MIKRSLAILLCGIMIISALPMLGVSAEVEEMLLDPGMEQIAAGWEDRHAGTGDKITYVTNEYRGGEKSIKAVNGSEFQTTRYEFDKSKGYKFSIWVKGSGRYWISVPCFDENGTALGTWAGWYDANRGTTYLESGNVTHSDWTQLTLGISEGGIVPPGTKYFRVHVRVLAKSGESTAELYFDDASLTSYGSTADEIKYDGIVNPNPGMGGDLWWAFSKAAQDYTTYHTAPVSAKIAYDSTVIDAVKEKQNAYNLDVNKHYELSVWAKTDSSTDAEVRLVMNTESAFKAITTFNPTTEWTQYKGYFKGQEVAPIGSSRKIAIQVRDGGTNGNIWVDDITLREVIIPGEITISGDDSINLPDFGSKDVAYTASVKDVNDLPMTNVELKWVITSDYPQDITISDSGVLTVTDTILPGKTATIKVSSVEFPDVYAEKTVTFTYLVTDEFKTQLQTLLKTGAEADTVAFLKSTSNNRPLAELGVKLEDFNSYLLDDDDRIAIATAVKAAATDVLEDNIALLNDAIFFRMINSADVSAIEDVLLAYDAEKALGLADNEIYILLNTDEMATAKQAAFTKIANASYTDADVLKADIDEKLAAAYLSFATSGQIEDALELVAVKAGLSTNSKYQAYKGLSSTNNKKLAINKAMVAEYDTYTDIYNKFILAYDNAPSGGSNGGGGGGGSTGGGGGSSSSNKGSSTIAVPYEPIIGEPSVNITPVPEVEKFNDMKAAEWAKDAVVALSDKGIINGYTDGSFRPDNKVTREEFLKMLLSAVGLVKDDAECDFADADKNEWYYKYIATAKELGVANGTTETSFGIGENITREQMAAFAMRAMEAAKLAENIDETEEKFADDNGISDYAKTAVYKMKKLGILNGYTDGSFKPQSGATRAEAAVVIYAIFNLN